MTTYLYIKPSFSFLNWVKLFSGGFRVAIQIVESSHNVRLSVNERIACTVLCCSSRKPELTSVTAAVFFKSSLHSWFRVLICSYVLPGIVTHVFKYVSYFYFIVV